MGCLLVAIGCGDGAHADADGAAASDVAREASGDQGGAQDAGDDLAVSPDSDPGPVGDGAASDLAGDGMDGPPSDAAPEGPPVLERTGLPLPAGVPPPRRLFDAHADLTAGHTSSSCSHQDPPSGDGHRWCAFSMRAANAARTELWVIDASRAAAGDVPVCDGTSPSCLLLARNLWTEFPLIGPGHPYAHLFEGDTLIFYADASSGKNEIHRGPVYAWRPGWQYARQLTSTVGLLCQVDRSGLGIVCMDDLAGDPVRWDSVEVRAGYRINQDGGLLPSLGRIKPASADGFPSWQAGFTPAGDVLAISSAYPEPGSEILRVVSSGSIGTLDPMPVLADVTSWTISNDGKKVYYFGQLTGQERELWVADFPAGTNPIKLADAVHDYLVLGEGPSDQGVGFLTRPIAITDELAFVMIRDPSMPAKAQTVFTYRGALEGVEISRDLQYTTWLSGDFRATAVHNQTLQRCVLNTGLEAAFDPQILASAGLAFWTEEATDGLLGRDGFVTSPASCAQKDRFARGMYWYWPVADQGLIYGDEYGAFERTVAMKYVAATLEGGTWRLGQPVRIDDGADPEFVMVGQTSPLLLYVKQHGDAATTGTYVFGPVPF